MSMTVPATGGMVPEYLSLTKCRQVAFPHVDVTVDDTSEHEHTATDYSVVRDEKPAELVGDLVERGLGTRNTVEGLFIAADNLLTSSSTVTKLSSIP